MTQEREPNDEPTNPNDEPTNPNDETVQREPADEPVRGLHWPESGDADNGDESPD